MKRWIASASVAAAAVYGLMAPGTAMASSGAWYQTLQVNTSGDFVEIAASVENAGSSVQRPTIYRFDL